MALNIIEQARLTRTIAELQRRIQRAEAHFSGLPISVVRIGDATITSAKIEDGSITTAKIANATIESAKINDLNASKITTGTLDADRIGAGTITASKLSVSTLSSITSNLGSVNAGTISGVTITGGTVRTASSGSRVELSTSPDRLRVYDGANQRVLMGSGSAIFYGDNSVRLYRNGSIYAQWSCSSTSFNMVSTSNAGGGLHIRTNEGGDIIFQASDKINMISPTVKFNGVTKTAIVPVKDEFRAVYCAEAPDVWFMDFQDDDLFKEVTEGQRYEFDCINDKKLIFARRKGYVNTRFESKTHEQFERNNQLYAT